jgi:dephospho-CoA kinase
VEVLRLPRSLHAREVFDVVWLCRAPESTRRARLMARDGLEVGEAQRRLNVQATQNIDDCSPDLILDTGGSLGELTDRVRAGWGMLEGLTGAQQ